ncbi:MAG: 2-oxoacid:acceptor oxidoreductase family protein [Candidatus Hermodarchaeota archaeon]
MTHNKQMKNSTIGIRWHGRGGQGAVTSAELVAMAAISEGKFAQAFPSFGPERRGAPVLAFNRIDTTKHIRVRASVTDPDIVVVLDPGLLYIADVVDGLKKNGTLVINSDRALDDIKFDFAGPWRLAVVNATAIAREMLGIPIVNTTMIGALVSATAIIKIDSLREPLEERFGARAKGNIDACLKAHKETKVAEPEAARSRRRTEFQVEKWPSWHELLPGCVVAEPGNASQYRTGDWKSQHPEYDNSKCIKCGICYIFCPEGCIALQDSGYYEPNLYYCKGCGICSQECPKDVITMIEET